MDGVKPLCWVKADRGLLEHAVKAESEYAQTEAEEQGGIVILPPLTTDEERNAYPEDYIAYCRERERVIIQSGNAGSSRLPNENYIEQGERRQ